MPLLDTQFLIEIIRGNTKAREMLESLGRSKEEVLMSSISAAELYQGANLHKNVEEKIEEVRALLAGTESVPVTNEIAQEYGRQRALLSKRGQQVKAFDVLIGSTAIIRTTRVITGDYRDFDRMDGLEVERFE